MMSTDRVQFVLGGSNRSFGSPQVEAELEAARIAFGLLNGEVAKIRASRTTIVCRPSQFARFLIYRNDMGGTNGFKDLEPKLIPTEASRVLDVSKNPANHNSEG